MLILPDRHIPRARLLLPVRAAEWRIPSQAQPKDQFGRENRTRFRVRAILNDGHIAWRGWFDDREDFDAFLWAIATGSLHYERELWRLPVPMWHPDFGEGVSYDFATVTFLTSPTGSNQTYTSPSDWNSSSNSVELLGSGASGGATNFSTNAHGTGGAGGSYASISNFVFATPGTTAATYQIGALSAAVSKGAGNEINGNNGNPTWFNNASDPGAGSDNTKAGAKGGSAGLAGTGAKAGGVGGVTATSWGQTKFAGGNGGAFTGGSTGTGGLGAGGAAGPSGDGGQGVDSASSSLLIVTDGGTANNGTTAGGSGSGAEGVSGTEWDGSHGSGSGGSGSTTDSDGGNGANYGGGGGGSQRPLTGTVLSGSGAQGIIVVTYTPSVLTGGWMRSTEDFVKPKSVFTNSSSPSPSLIPDTSPPKISGMGWRQPPDPKRQSWFKNDPAAFAFTSISVSLPVLGWQPQQIDQAPFKIAFIDRPVFVPQAIVQLEPTGPPGSGKRKDFSSYAPQPAYDVKKRPPVQPIWDRRRRNAAEDELARERAAARLPIPMPPASLFATPQPVSYPQPTQFAPHQVQRIAQKSSDARDIADIQGVADMQGRDASDMQDVSDIMQLIKGLE